MVKTLYHGSKDIIEHPRYGAGKPYNDYGRGFYCTESLDLAKEWAVAVDRRCRKRAAEGNRGETPLLYQEP